ncbi:ABC-type multidrug transport system, ATPase component [Gottschalkia purinilytica]|uniref:ABC-type multidrug transport system, ATPase component n=1 Tax=Gottschalkia purinilytica TaxID=1503 RepID=A0A0L0W8Y2_GOTPU|nr:ABC transporter ATP-binding protein [Gottschalkia purinilytica]KNF07917.1 ABC-type multidrug transport system, ATPase component [Gottschalkia purinilytica]
MGSNIVEIKGLSKNYIRKKALKDVNLNLEKGKILGLLGQNGSGKTTLMKIMAGLLRKSSGEILIDGHSPGIYTKSVVSYLPDRSFLYKWMKVKDAIDFYKDFFDDFDEKKMDELLDFMKLPKDAKVTTFSKGMTEKMNLSLALSRKAKLYILDEPIGGVDPATRDKILDAIINNYTEDSSMIITTHLVTDIERVFDEVAFIKEGEIILSGDAEELRQSKGKSINDIFKEVSE